MAREDFSVCSDEEIRSEIYIAASVRAARWSKAVKRSIEAEDGDDGVAGEFSHADLEDWYVMGIARQFGVESLFDELFDSPLGRRFQELSKEVALCH